MGKFKQGWKELTHKTENQIFLLYWDESRMQWFKKQNISFQNLDEHSSCTAQRSTLSRLSCSDVIRFLLLFITLRVFFSGSKHFNVLFSQKSPGDSAPRVVEFISAFTRW